MRFEELLETSVELLEKMSDSELLEHLGPTLKNNPPIELQIILDSKKKEDEEKLKKKEEKKLEKLLSSPPKPPKTTSSTKELEKRGMDKIAKSISMDQNAMVLLMKQLEQDMLNMGKK
jgi:hypothetical protein